MYYSIDFVAYESSNPQNLCQQRSKSLKIYSQLVECLISHQCISISKPKDLYRFKTNYFHKPSKVMARIRPVLNKATPCVPWSLSKTLMLHNRLQCSIRIFKILPQQPNLSWLLVPSSCYDVTLLFWTLTVVLCNMARTSRYRETVGQFSRQRRECSRQGARVQHVNVAVTSKPKNEQKLPGFVKTLLSLCFVVEEAKKEVFYRQTELQRAIAR